MSVTLPGQLRVHWEELYYSLENSRQKSPQEKLKWESGRPDAEAAMTEEARVWIAAKVKAENDKVLEELKNSLELATQQLIHQTMKRVKDDLNKSIKNVSSSAKENEILWVRKN